MGVALVVALGCCFGGVLGFIFVSSLIAGVIVGYFVGDSHKSSAKNGFVVGFVGGLILSILMFLVTFNVFGFSMFPQSVNTAELKTLLIILFILAFIFMALLDGVLCAVGGVLGFLLKRKVKTGVFFPVNVEIVDRDVCILVIGFAGTFLIFVSILLNIYISIFSLILGLIAGYLVFRIKIGVLVNLFLGFVCGLIAGIFFYLILTFNIMPFYYSPILPLTFALIGALSGVLGVLVRYLRLGSDSCQVWLEEGDVLFDAGRFNDAIKFYDKALDEDIENIDALVGIGDALRELGNYEEAMECYEEALDIDDEDAELWFNRGEILNELKRYDDALNSLNKALKLEPNCEPALKMKKELEQIRE